MFKVWYIDTNNHEVISDELFTTREEAHAYVSDLEAKGLISETCLQAEGARVFPAGLL